MRRIWFILTLALTVSLIALAQQRTAPASSATDPTARAQEVIKQARTAIWDETKSRPLESLTINATSRTVQGERQSTNEVTLDVLLPDKFLQTTSRNVGAAEFTSMIGINGTQTWTDFRQPEFGGSPDGMAMRRGGNDGGASREGQEIPSNALPQVNHPEFARLLLAWLLVTPATMPTEFTYVGEAKADGKTADVLDAKMSNGFATRLFIAQQTHQLLMLTYQMKMPKQEAQASVSEAEMRWVVSDYRNVNGINLPHRLTKSINGQAMGEVEIHKVKVNPSLKPSKFEKKGK